MKPFLFANTLFETPTYYVLYLLAFLGAILLGTYKAKKDGLSPVRAVDLGIVIFISGVIGARLFHILIEAPKYYLAHPIRVFYFWQGGVVLYGGIIIGILASYLFIRALKEPLGRWADVVAPCLLLGIGIGRVGCLAAGCCYGSETQLFWGMVFTDPRSAAPLGIPIHPTQALEMLFGFISCFIFLKVFRGPTKWPGVSFVMMLLVYSVFRFFIEFLRGDIDRGVYFQSALSTSQLISLVLIVGCVGWLASRVKFFGKKLN
ncbi:MAG: prolipoprotein diacylglyceryl transferase [Bacteriovoracaceae bacterium]|nr:prolipoprotein diacylglyceryl transferase [Bacteriovoracaceae bacterium]